MVIFILCCFFHYNFKYVIHFSETGFDRDAVEVNSIPSTVTLPGVDNRTSECSSVCLSCLHGASLSPASLDLLCARCQKVVHVDIGAGGKNSC